MFYQSPPPSENIIKNIITEGGGETRIDLFRVDCTVDHSRTRKFFRYTVTGDLFALLYNHSRTSRIL